MTIETPPMPGPATIAEHLADCQRVTDVVRNANVMVQKARDELARARNAFETLAKLQHPMVMVSTSISATAYCTANAQYISDLLGDRPKLG